jgi:LPS sulfotransferase NodH
MKESAMLDINQLLRNTRFYTIAFTMRSGTNVLCDYLGANGLGRPTEYFQHPYGVANKRLYDEFNVPVDDFVGFLEQLIARRSQNNIFGSKITWDHKNVLQAEMAKYVGMPDSCNIFPGNSWIYVSRGDKISQAISLWRAKKSGSWTSRDQTPANKIGQALQSLRGKPGAAEPSAEQRAAYPEYDFHAILYSLFVMLAEDHMWQDFFNRNVIKPLMVTYEAFEAAPQKVVCDIVNAVWPERRLTEERVVVASKLKVQRDDYSAQMRARFVEDMDHIGIHSHWATRQLQGQRWSRFFANEEWNDTP